MKKEVISEKEAPRKEHDEVERIPPGRAAGTVTH
jgi:hypothetical protein